MRTATKESGRDSEQLKTALPGEQKELRTFSFKGKMTDLLFLVIPCDNLDLALAKKKNFKL